MSRSHGLVSAFETQAWAAPARTPPFYPDAVTLVPEAAVAALVHRIDITSAGASVKDSFADLDLTDANFQVLFEAQWIHRPARAPAIAPGLSWNVADDHLPGLVGATVNPPPRGGARHCAGSSLERGGRPRHGARLGARLGQRERQPCPLSARTARRPRHVRARRTVRLWPGGGRSSG